jgi:hypothetical protein
MNIIFQIDGGIGKCLASTAVVRAIRNKYPEDTLIVVTGWPDVFINNPRVNRVVHFGSLGGFYDDHVKGQEVLFLKAEPYQHSEYIAQTKHLIECWTEQLGLDFDGLTPEFYPFASEEDQVLSFVAQAPKPLLVFQPFGGPVGSTPDDA